MIACAAVMIAIIRILNLSRDHGSQQIEMGATR